MSAGSSRRKPWPWDVMIGTIGVMLKPTADGLLVGRKTETLERVVTTDYGYGSLPPFLERTYAIKRIQGVGEKIQTTAVLGRRWRYGINLDNVGGLTIKGPDVTSVLPSVTGEIRGFVEALHGGVMTLFGLAGRYVLRRSDDTGAGWGASRDFGVGQITRQAARFMDSSGSPVDGLYVALESKEFWRYDGTAWAQMGTSATIPASAIAVLNEELWRGYDNRVQKLNTGSDPSVATSYAGAILVGDASSSITWLAVVRDQLFIFKDDGSIYTINGTGASVPLFPALGTSASTTHGRNAAGWLDSLWARRGDGLIRLDSGTVVGLTPVGPELLLENDSEVRGVPVAFVGHQTWHGYLGVHNPSNGNSYLWKFGTWLNPDDDNSAEFRFSPDWNGALVRWTGKRVTAMGVSSIPGVNERLYVGFADGTIDWLVLPYGTPNPLADSACRFTTTVSDAYWPLHHAMFQADAKSFRGFSAFGPTLNATSYVTQEYRTDPSAAYTAVGTSFQANGQRVDLTDGTSGMVLDTVTHLVNTVNTATPVLEGMALHENVRPALKLTYSMVIDARGYIPKRDGSADRRTADQLRSAVKVAAQTAGAPAFTLPDESVKALQVFDYAEHLKPNRQRSGMAWEIPISAVEFKTNETYGTIDRLLAYQVNDLSGYSIEQMGTL